MEKIRQLPCKKSFRQKSNIDRKSKFKANATPTHPDEDKYWDCQVHKGHNLTQ